MESKTCHRHIHFRAILPELFQKPLSRCEAHTTHVPLRHPFASLGEGQKRNFFFKSRQKPQTEEISDPYKHSNSVIRQFVRHHDEQIGSCPPVPQLLQAYRTIIGRYFKNGGTLNIGNGEILPEHVTALSRIFEYLGRHDCTPQDIDLCLLHRSLQLALEVGSGSFVQMLTHSIRVHPLNAAEDFRLVLQTLGAAKSSMYATVAESVYTHMLARNDYVPGSEDFLLYIRAICHDELSLRAFEICKSTQCEDMRVWRVVISQIADIGGLEEVYTYLDQQGLKLDPAIQWHYRVMVAVGRQGGLQSALDRWKCMKDLDIPPLIETFEYLMEVCVRRKDYAQACSVFNDLWLRCQDGKFTSDVDEKKYWTAAMRWCIMLRSLDQCSQQISNEVPTLDEVVDALMRKRVAGTMNALNFDTSMLNEVLEVASNQSLDLEDHIYNAAQSKWKIPLDRNTQVIHLISLLRQGRLAGAQQQYLLLKHQYTTPRGREDHYDAQELRSLIQSLCSRDPPPSTEAITDLMADLFDRGCYLDRDTLRSLVCFHLTTGTLDMLEDLLSSMLPDFGPQTCKSIVGILMDYIASSETSILAAWDAFVLLRDHLLKYMDKEHKLQLIKIFMSLSRVDLAATIFAQCNRPPHRSTTVDEYILMFEGIAKARDMEILRQIHAMLNIDSCLPNPHPTRLLNAMMEAYAACGLLDRAARIWGTIRASQEGPDHDSVSIILRIYGKRAAWKERVKKVWKSLLDSGATPNIDNIVAYVEALGRQGEWEKALGFVESLAQDEARETR